jgi:hypothetical protein
VWSGGAIARFPISGSIDSDDPVARRAGILIAGDGCPGLSRAIGECIRCGFHEAVEEFRGLVAEPVSSAIE